MHSAFLLGGVVVALVVVTAGVFRLSDVIARGAAPGVWAWFGPVRRTQLLDHRRHRGLCECCGYDLTGNVSGVCPECGGAATSTA
jgi:hypothetical protein